MTGWTPTTAWLDAVYAQQVRPAIFGQAVTTDSPTLVMIGGQPAAGKTRAGNWAAAQYADPLAEVTGDDLRYLHPDFRRLKRDAPMQMPNVTQQVSGPLVARCIDEALARRYSLQLEGVFRDAAVVTATIDRFHAAGFCVHAIAVAVPPQVSRVSAVNRFLTEGRWTPLTGHDSVVHALPTTVEAVATHRHVDRFTAVDRDGVLMDSRDPGPSRGQQARDVIQHAHTRPLTQAEARDVSTLQRGIAEAAALPATRLGALGADIAESTTRWAAHGPPPPPEQPLTLPSAVTASFPTRPQVAVHPRTRRPPSPSTAPTQRPGRDLSR